MKLLPDETLRPAQQAQSTQPPRVLVWVDILSISSRSLARVTESPPAPAPAPPLPKACAGESDAEPPLNGRVVETLQGWGSGGGLSYLGFEVQYLQFRAQTRLPIQFVTFSTMPPPRCSGCLFDWNPTTSLATYLLAHEKQTDIWL